MTERWTKPGFYPGFPTEVRGGPRACPLCGTTVSALRSFDVRGEAVRLGVSCGCFVGWLVAQGVEPTDPWYHAVAFAVDAIENPRPA